jgi:predicted DNA-binding protein YlxM (UPF0122 family)
MRDSVAMRLAAPFDFYGVRVTVALSVLVAVVSVYPPFTLCHNTCGFDRMHYKHREGMQMAKIDINKALQLRLKKGLSYAEIDEYFGTSNGVAHSALQRFTNMLVDRGELEVYKSNKGAILESIELQLLSDISDEGKREKASLNNVAYALGQVSSMTRLEKGQSTANVAYQDMNQSLSEIRRQREQLQEVLENM